MVPRAMAAGRPRKRAMVVVLVMDMGRKPRKRVKGPMALVVTPSRSLTVRRRRRVLMGMGTARSLRMRVVDTTSRAMAGETNTREATAARNMMTMTLMMKRSSVIRSTTTIAARSTMIKLPVRYLLRGHRLLLSLASHSTLRE